MDINNPQLVWIQGRCHRINPTVDKAGVDIRGDLDSTENENNHRLATYQETDLYGDDDRDFGDIQMINDKFVCSVPVPSVLHSRLIGPKGAVKKRLEHETKCQVKIPRMGMDGPVEVTGLTRDDVISCRQRMDMILTTAKMKMRPTHFVGVPFQSAHLLERFQEFTAGLDKYPASGITPDMITSPQKLHVTFNTLVLLDDNDRKKAMTSLREFIEASGETVKNIEVSIKGLGSFQENKLNKCHVLYAQIQSEKLQELANRIYLHFIEQGLSFREHGRDTVAMHMTLIKGSKAFDCEQLFNENRDFDFGTIVVKEVHLSQMSTVDPDTGYYKPSLVVPV